MATETTLRELLRTTGDDLTTAIDTGSVIRRSKARRLPLQLGLGGAFALAIGGVGIVGVQGLVGGTSGTAESSVSSGESPATGNDTADQEVHATDGATGGISLAPAEKLHGCGGPLAEVAPSATGLVLTAAFPDSPAGATAVEGTVTMTNTGAETITGHTPASPAVTLSQGGIVIWHSNGPTIQMLRQVQLAPGESFDYAASFTPVVCGVDDESAPSFRDGLPPAPAGEYAVSAAIDLTMGEHVELVSGPLAAIRLN
jgi:hypothetical protein